MMMDNEQMLFDIENAWMDYNASIVSHAGKTASRDRLANILINYTPDILKLMKPEVAVTGDVATGTKKKGK